MALTSNSWISCSFVARRMTRALSRRRASDWPEGFPCPSRIADVSSTTSWSPSGRSCLGNLICIRKSKMPMVRCTVVLQSTSNTLLKRNTRWNGEETWKHGLPVLHTAHYHHCHVENSTTQLSSVSECEVAHAYCSSSMTWHTTRVGRTSIWVYPRINKTIA